MSEIVVVAGATGYAGRYLVQALHDAGYRVRAIVRSRERAESPGAYGAPSLHGLVEEWVEAQITDPDRINGVCAGADRVVSALGVTRQKADPWDVDFLANLHLLGDAERGGVRSFTYVNVMHMWSGRSMILRSKAAFTAALTRSSVAHHLINPSGYFSDVSEFLTMARTGVVLLPPRPDVRIAPIHGADLAGACLERIAGPSGSWDVGGPEVMTYRDVARLAFRALGKQGRTVVVHGSLARGTVELARHLDRRSRDLAEFFADGLTQDAIGDRCGTRRLEDYFNTLANGNDQAS